ncbi:MAG: peptidylprolyl isomerase [Planctomycetota bacterium]
MQSRTLHLSVLIGLSACAGPQPPATVPDQPPAGTQPSQPWQAVMPRKPVVLVPQDLDQAIQSLGPEILLPTKNPDDAKMAEVSGVVIRKSHVYDRLLEKVPVVAARYLDHLVFDALLAQEAKRHGITVDPKRIDEAVDKKMKDLREQVEKDWNKQLSFDEYCQRVHGKSPENHRKLERLLLARDLYRNYVIRYLATLEDRVQVRIFAHSDRKVVEDVRQRAQQGADFKSLVLRKRSQHKPSNRNGGLLPAFGRDYPSPLTEHAFRLKPGDLSEVVEVESGGSKYYYLLFCLKQMQGRKRSFLEVRNELDEELRRNPLTPEERQATYIRLRSRSEALKNPGERR